MRMADGGEVVLAVTVLGRQKLPGDTPRGRPRGPVIEIAGVDDRVGRPERLGGTGRVGRQVFRQTGNDCVIPEQIPCRTVEDCDFSLGELAESTRRTIPAKQMIASEFDIERLAFATPRTRREEKSVTDRAGHIHPRRRIAPGESLQRHAILPDAGFRMRIPQENHFAAAPRGRNADLHSKPPGRP